MPTLHVCASQRVRATFSVCDLYTPRPARSRENSRELAAMRDRACAGKKCFVAPPGEPLGGHWAHSRASAGAPRPRYTSRHLLASVLQREVGEVVASPTQNLGAPSALSLQASKHLASTVRALVRPWLAAILALPGPLTPPPKRRDAQRLVGCDLLSAARCSVRAPAARKQVLSPPRRLRACTPPVGCPRCASPAPACVPQVSGAAARAATDGSRLWSAPPRARASRRRALGAAGAREQPG